MGPVAKEDLALFRAALAGEHNINGFSNCKLQARLYRRPPADAKRGCQRTSRLIIKLRGHGFIAKVPRRRHETSAAVASTFDPTPASEPYQGNTPRQRPQRMAEGTRLRAWVQGAPGRRLGPGRLNLDPPPRDT